MKIFDSKKSNQLLIYVNPGFNGDHGYYINHAKKVLTEVDHNGIAFLHLTNRELNAALAAKYRASPIFTRRPHLTLSTEYRERWAVCEDFFNTMTEVLQRADVTSYKSIYVYMYSGHPLYAAVLAKVFNELKVRAHAFVNFLYNEKELEALDLSGELAQSLMKWGEVLTQNDVQEQIVCSVDCPWARDLYVGLLGRKVASCQLAVRYLDT